MATTYNELVNATAKSSPFSERNSADGDSTVLSVKQSYGKDDKKYKDLTFYGQSNGKVLATPRSIMNEHVGVNYRTIYNGFATPTKGIDTNNFTLYDDYMRCMNTKDAYIQYMKDKRNPTYANILKYYNDEQFDPKGVARYKMQDFIYLKYYNQIPNNFMITLRRYPNPIGDHIVGLDYNADTRLALNKMNQDSYAIATAVTYMGEQTGNKLSDILKFDYGANWEHKTAQVNQLQSPDGGLQAQMGKWGVDSTTMAGENGRFDFKGSALMSAAGVISGRSVSSMMATQHQYPTNEYIATYGEQFYGDINSIVDTEIRSRGLTFTNSFQLNFEYSLKSLKCVNPRVAMMDILSNFLLLTGNYGSFWGGETIFYGVRTIGPQFGNPAFLRNGQYGKYLNSLWSDVKSGLTDFANRHKDSNGSVSIIGLAKEIISGGLQALLGNFLGGNIGNAGEAACPPALLSGEPTGFWHLTIGNPLDPIAMMGNMKIDKTTVQFNDVLGYDDFPTEIKFTVDISHGKPRDNGGIENMFNGTKGRFYVLSKEFENSMNIPNPPSGFKGHSGSQEASMYNTHKGEGQTGPFTNGKLSVIGSLLG